MHFVFPFTTQPETEAQGESLDAKILRQNRLISRLRVDEGRPEHDPELLAARQEFQRLIQLLPGQ